MSASLALALGLSAACVLVWPGVGASSRVRLRRSGAGREPGVPGEGAPLGPVASYRGVPAPPRAAASRAGGRGVPAVRAAAGLAGVGAGLVVGGLPGLVVGLGVCVLLDRGLRSMEPAALRRQRARVRRDLPAAVDLLAACLCAGATVEAATTSVARAVGGPVGSALHDVDRAVSLGTPAVEAWAALAIDSELEGLARAMTRTVRGGAPAADVLGDLADDLRDQRRSDGLQAAQRVGVHAVAPLAVCFLPAFVLLGVVPLVLALGRQLLAGGP